MKMLSTIVAMLMLLAGCSNTQTQVTDPVRDYKFLSISWGASREAAEKSEALQGASIEIERDDALSTVMVAKGVSFYENTVDAMLLFSKTALCEGLNQVVVRYQEENEGDLLAKMTAEYGERQTYFLDKDGIENPINPAGWYTEERLETMLTEEEQAKLTAPLKEKRHSDARIAAVLRQPLVIINFDEEQNEIVFKGTDAATVNHMKK